MLPFVLGKQLRTLVVGGAKGRARILTWNSLCLCSVCCSLRAKHLWCEPHRESVRVSPPHFGVH